jgi:putative hemolysin
MEILVIVLLTILNGVFSMAEIAVVSSRKARLQQWADEGRQGARAALELANAPNRFLSTVQVGITLIGILTGAFGGATIAEGLAEQFRQVPALVPYSDALSFGIVVSIVTYLSLVIGELVPKRLGLHNPEGVALLIAPPMRWLSLIAAPLIRLLGFSTDLILRVLRLKPSTEPPVTEEEIHLLLETGAGAGIFNAVEQAMIAGVFSLDDLRADALMTPRTEIVALDVDDPVDDVRRKIIEHNHSRFPVYKETQDNILGIVHTKDLLKHSLSGQPFDLKSVLRKPLFVPESTPVSKILERFKATGIHEALVIDEYGGAHGLLTLTDILKALVGTLDASEPQVVQREDGSWLVDGLLPIQEFKSRFAVKELLDENEANYQTLAGFVMLHQGRIPAVGDHFEWSGLYFAVVDMDDRRIDKILVKRVELPPDDGAAS